jgi:hypothetical protein
MDFLHLAHRNLISELGSTQPIMRLVASLGTVRNKIMQVRSKMPASSSAASYSAGGGGEKGRKAAMAAAASATDGVASASPLTLLLLSVTGLNVFLLLLSPPLSSTLLNSVLPLGMILVLCLLLLVVWSAQYPFAPSSAASLSNLPFPSSVWSGAMGGALLVSLEPLHYLRARLGEKEAETKQRMDEGSGTGTGGTTSGGAGGAGNSTAAATSPTAAAGGNAAPPHQLLHDMRDEDEDEQFLMEETD